MANVQKYTRGQIGVLTRHFERGQKENGSYFQSGNRYRSQRFNRNNRPLTKL